MARITRKELKSDRFALEVEHTVTFFEHHQKELVRYGAIAIAAILLMVGYMIYARHQHAAREEALAKAIAIQEAPVGAPNPGSNLNFPTQDAKDQVAVKAFAGLSSLYPGTEEGYIADYYLASITADQGKLAEAETRFKSVADKADARYSSLAKLSLAQLYFGDGRPDQAESVLRDLMAHPTVYVSHDQAALTLARYLGQKKPAEARKLLEPLRSKPGVVGQNALGILGELPAQ